MRALQLVGQIDEEHFIEPSFAQELGREFGNIVGGRHHEHRFFLFLHPAQERAEHPGGSAAISGTTRLAAGETLFDFIDPQHTRRDGLGGLDDGSQVGFRLADDAAEDTAHVESEQWQAERAGRGFGR